MGPRVLLPRGSAALLLDYDMDISQDKLEITLDVAGELEGEDLKPLKEAMVCYYESLPKDGQSQGWKQEVQDIVMFCGALIYVMTHHIKQLILTGLIGQDEDQLSRIIGMFRLVNSILMTQNVNGFKNSFLFEISKCYFKDDIELYEKLLETGKLNRIVSINETEKFKSPTKTSKRPRLEETSTKGVSTKNKYVLLSSHDNMDQDIVIDKIVDVNSNEKNSKVKTVNQNVEFKIAKENSKSVVNKDRANVNATEKTIEKKEPKAECFFIKFTDNYQALLKKLNELTKNKVSGKLSGDMLKLEPKDADAYRAVQRHLLSEKIPFHSLNLKNERPKKVVLKGLPVSFDIEDLKKILTEEAGLDIVRVSQLRNTKTRMPLPIFLLSLRPTADWQKVYTLKQVAYMAVKVQTFRARGFKICYRCQQFNHSSENCSMPPKCLKCAQGHLTRDCTRPKTEKATCANCDGDHPANFRLCPKNPWNRGKAPVQAAPPPQNMIPAWRPKPVATKPQAPPQDSSHTVPQRSNIKTSAPTRSVQDQAPKTSKELTHEEVIALNKKYSRLYAEAAKANLANETKTVEVTNPAEVTRNTEKTKRVREEESAQSQEKTVEKKQKKTETQTTEKTQTAAEAEVMEINETESETTVDTEDEKMEEILNLIKGFISRFDLEFIKQLLVQLTEVFQKNSDPMSMCFAVFKIIAALNNNSEKPAHHA